MYKSNVHYEKIALIVHRMVSGGHDLMAVALRGDDSALFRNEPDSLPYFVDNISYNTICSVLSSSI